MGRRSFIKLTAITGTSATLASCGNPENQLIRFIPAEDIVPGVAVWKPGVCPLCAAGCGLTVRIMGADAEVVRDGQAGVVRIAAAKKLPTFAWWPNLIIMFEMTMLGAITATVATLVVSALLPTRGRTLYDPEVTDGQILVGVEHPSEGSVPDLERTLGAPPGACVKTV